MQGSKENADVENGPFMTLGQGEAGELGAALKRHTALQRNSQRGRRRVPRGSARARLEGMGVGDAGGSRGRGVCVPTGDSC